MVQKCAENKLVIEVLRGPEADGYYFACTDKAPGPGGYKYLTQGIFRLGDLVVPFTVLANDASEGVGRQTIAILEKAAHAKGRSSSSAEGAPRADGIQIKQREGDFLLTVPMSRLVLDIPGGDLSQGKDAPAGSSNNPRYFYFEGLASHLAISGWFESEQEFPGMKKIWERETSTWKRNGLPEPRGVSFKKISNWDAVVYGMDLPQASFSHIRAHWVQAGTWIDIELSIPSGQSSQNARTKLESLLRGISVSEKKKNEP
jgi:hypothetical protein